MHATSGMLKLAPLLMAMVIVAAGCGGGSETGRQSMTAEQQAFDMLDQYGTWIDIPAYGTVWRPNVSADWRPYLYGHWVWSDQGWVWIGYEPFAWVVYHYGSWYNDRGAGWVWVPAYDWSPAQVAWASSDDYIGWAPLAPRGATMVQPGDPYWDQMWILVPAARFRQENVGSYNTSKGSGGTGRVRGTTQTPPDFEKVRRLSAGGDATMKVDLERVGSRGRDLLRLKLPAEQEKIVESRSPEIQKKVLVPEKAGGTRQEVDTDRSRPAQPVDRDVKKSEPQPVRQREVEKPVKQPQVDETPVVKPPPPVRQVEKPAPAKEEKKAAPHKAVKPATPPKAESPKAEKPKEAEPKDTPK